jgi:hypothetical protein
MKIRDEMIEPLLDLIRNVFDMAKLRGNEEAAFHVELMTDHFANEGMFSQEQIRQLLRYGYDLGLTVPALMDFYEPTKQQLDQHRDGENLYLKIR